MKRIFSIILIISSCLTSCGDATKDIFTNYDEKKPDISSLETYFTQIKPKELALYIRFNSEHNIDFKLDQKDYWDRASWYIDDIFDKYGQFHRFDVDLDNEELRKALRIVKLDERKIDQLRKLLEKANCNSIGNSFSFSKEIPDKFISIGYPTTDLYGLEYLIFERELKTYNVNEIVRSSSFKKINNKIFVQYSGPAFGSDCFPDKR